MGVQNVLMVTSEYYGLVKSGGLADMAASLSEFHKADGKNLIAVMPFYSKLIREESLVEIPSMEVYMPEGVMLSSVRKIVRGNVDIYLIEYEDYFGRDGMYNDKNLEYEDNPKRFGYFSMATLCLCEAIGFEPDIIHCNDWQSALVPLYLSWKKQQGIQNFKSSKTLLTIHNGTFQGKYSPSFRHFLGLGIEPFINTPYEEFGHINLLKGGVILADWVNTVSPTYAEELLTPDGSHGLHQAYTGKNGCFSGILNGIDHSVWNPKIDPFIKKNYSDLDRRGKKECVKDLLATMGIKYEKNTLVVGMVTRLTHQKGIRHVIDMLSSIELEKIVFICLGDGDVEFTNQLNALHHTHPKNIFFYHGYDETLAHKIEAGSHIFIMPSLFEPCGLNQMYSLKYGTLPIVRSVGGLKDTVINFDYNLNGESNGFVFHEASSEALKNTFLWAADIFWNRAGHFNRMVARAMKANFGNEKCGGDYSQLYDKVFNLE